MTASIPIIVLFWILAALTVPAILELALVTAGMLLPGAKREMGQRPVRHIKVVVPAHNEEPSIARCVTSLRGQFSETPFETIVIADNCSDRTAGVASEAGARVLVRNAPDQRGKGCALRFAFDTLQGEDFDAVLVIDADSMVSENLIAEVARRLREGADCVQCRYLVLDAARCQRDRLLHLALLAFNVLRPLGRSRWGLSAGLLGNGFAISRSVLEKVPYLANSVVEDLEYHLMLLRAGFRVEFADAATVWGEAPGSKTAVRSQRSRWEGGRLRMIREHALDLAAEVAKGRARLIEPLLELLTLPLAFEVALLGSMMLLPWRVSRLYAALALTIVAAHVLAAARLGGDFRGALRTLASAPLYVFWKSTTIPALWRGSRRNAQWIRTARNER